METIPIEAIRQCMNIAPADMLQGTAQAAPTADPAAVARFQELMAEPVAVDRVDGADAPRMQIPFAERLEASWKAQQQQYQDHLHAIDDVLSRTKMGELTQADLMRLQYEMQSLSFQQNVVSKVIEGASSAIQTLIKNS